MARCSCGSKIPTESAPLPRTSSRSSTRCAGWSWTGTETRSSRSQRADRHREALEQLLAPVTPTTPTPRPRTCSAFKERHGADRGFRGEAGGVGRGAPAGAGEGETVRVDDLIRGETTFAREHMDDPVIARADGSRALQLRRRGRRPRRRHHPRRARRGPPVQHPEAAGGPARRSARSRPPTPTCRCCTARTARSSPSATVRPRCRSCATPATCLRRCGTTSPCSAGATRTTTKFSDRGAAAAVSHRGVSRNPARFDENEAALAQWALPARAAARRADRAAGGVHGSRGTARGRGDRPGEDPDAGGLLAAGRLPVRRPGRRSGGVGAGHGSQRRQGDAGRRRARRWPAPSRSTWRPWRPRCAASSSVSA